MAMQAGEISTGLLCNEGRIHQVVWSRLSGAMAAALSAADVALLYAYWMSKNCCATLAKSVLCRVRMTGWFLRILRVTAVMIPRRPTLTYTARDRLVSG